VGKLPNFRMRDIMSVEPCRTGGRVARHVNGCSPSTVYIEELLDERAAALSSLGGNGNI
jgi:hypothetical protein